MQNEQWKLTEFYDTKCILYIFLLNSVYVHCSVVVLYYTSHAYIMDYSKSCLKAINMLMFGRLSLQMQYLNLYVRKEQAHCNSPGKSNSLQGYGLHDWNRMFNFQPH